MKRSRIINVLSKKARIATMAFAISGVVPAGLAFAHGELVAAEAVAQENTRVSGLSGATVTVPVQVWLTPAENGTNKTDAATVTVNLAGQTQHNKTVQFAANEFNTKKTVNLEYTIPSDAKPGDLSLKIEMSSNVTTGNNQVWNKKDDSVTIHVETPAPPIVVDNTPPVVSLIDPISGIFSETSLPTSFEFSLDENSEVFVNGQSQGNFVPGTHALSLPTPAQGENTVAITASDASGNKSEIVRFSYTYDSIVPEVTATPDRKPNNNGWYNQDVVVTFTAKDEEGGTGIQEGSISGSVTVSKDGIHSISGIARDNAGNEGEEAIEIKLDKTAPVINDFEDGAVFTLHQDVNWIASDNLSGLVTPENGTLDTSSLGKYTVTAEDEAGNITKKSYTVVYDFGGILQPINQDGTSVFKAGSTVPVKFQLKDANGAFITDAVAKIGYSKLSNNVWGDMAEAVSTSAATSGNLFRYDAKENQYIFNLNTKGLSSGTYKLIITLNDGTTQNIQISLK